jgi:formylglycine-generating enzyme required for sulfatase activity
MGGAVRAAGALTSLLTSQARRVRDLPRGLGAKGGGEASNVDLAGNVWEYTASLFGSYADGGAAGAEQVHRGGGWFTVDPHLVSTTVRHHQEDTFRNFDVGFRCARD